MLDIQGYGRIASNIEVKQSKDKKHMYTNFLFASHINKETTFIRCVAFDAMATLLQEFFSKGDRIIIKGELISDDYQDKKNRFKIKITDFEFVETMTEHQKNKEKHSVKTFKKEA